MTNEHQQPEENSSEIDVCDVTEPKPSCARKARCWIVVSIFIILLVALGVASFLNYKMTIQLRESIVSDVTTTQQLKNSVATLSANLAQENLQLNQLKQQMSQVMDSSNGLQRHWALVEAQYLVQLANYNLQFQGNVASSLTLLEMADKRIANLSDNSLLPIRTALADDTTALQTYSATDLAGILLKLTGLSQSVAQLPTVTAHTLIAREQTVSQSTQPAVSTSTWRQELTQVWQNLKSLIVIRHHSETVDPLLIAADQTYLTQHLQLLLAQAQWAVLHQQPAVFSKSIQQAVVWIGQYYDQKSPVTGNFLQQLNNLAKVTLKPNFPGINSSLIAIQSELSSKAETLSSTSKQP